MPFPASAEHRDSSSITRRALARGTAWAVPAAAVAVTAPALAVSPRCVAELSTSSPLFTPQRTSSTAFDYLWTNPFGDGSDVRLHVTAQLGSGPGSLHGSRNLLWAGPPTTGPFHGGVDGATNALQFSVDTIRNQTAGTIVDYTFEVQYRASSASSFSRMAAADVPDLRFSITDFEGRQSARGNYSAERGWISGTSWTKSPRDPAYLLGSGTAGSPWTARTAGLGANDQNLVDNHLPRGTVDVVAAAPTSSWTFSYGVDISGTISAPDAVVNSNAWFAAPELTVQQPGCG